MRIIVTGGFGFIGSSFVNTIIRKNPTAEIVVVDKLTYAANPNNINGKVSFIKKDICEVTAKDLGTYDYLVNFAAESHVDNSIKNGMPFIRSNVEGTFNLIQVALQNSNLKKFIQISTDEVYGDMADYGNAEATENSSLHASSYYSASKAAADLLVESAHRTFGLPYIITRTCNNYGSHQHAEKFLPTVMKSIQNGTEIPVYGDGSNVREWIDVDDNTLIIYELMKSDHVNRIFNIGSGERYSNLQIIEMIAEIIGKTPSYKFVEDRKGHDKMYALNNSTIKEIFPSFEPLSFKEFLKEQLFVETKQ